MHMKARRGKMVSGGRLHIPADMRRALGLADGDPVLFRILDGALHVSPVHEALSKVRSRLRAYIPVGECLSGEIIVDRRNASEHR